MDLAIAFFVAAPAARGSIRYGEAMAAYAPSAYYGYAVDQRALFRPSLVRDTMVHWLVRPHGGFLARLLSRAAGVLQRDAPALRAGHLREALVHLHHRRCHVRPVLRSVTASSHAAPPRDAHDD